MPLNITPIVRRIGMIVRLKPMVCEMSDRGGGGAGGGGGGGGGVGGCLGRIGRARGGWGGRGARCWRRGGGLYSAWRRWAGGHWSDRASHRPGRRAGGARHGRSAAGGLRGL